MKKTLLPLTIALLFECTQTTADETITLKQMEIQHKEEVVAAKEILEKANKSLEKNYEKYGLFSKETATDYKVLSEAHYKIGDLQSSIEYALHALKVEMKLQKENDPALAKLYFDTGNKYYMNKQHPTAMLYMEKAVEIYRNSPKKESLSLADTYEAIASIYINLDDYKKSLLFAEKCLLIREKKLEKEDKDLRRAQQNILFLKEEVDKRSASLIETIG